MIGNRNYENGKIYKLVNDVNDKFYVGSTVNSLAKRKYWHKSKGKMVPRVKAIYDEIGWNQLKIVLVESYPCDSNDELRQRERYWYDELKPDLNMIRPWVGIDEAKHEKKQLKKQYYENNVDTIKQLKKQYRENNKDKINDKAKQYRENNVDKIKQPTECICGVTIRKSCLPRHQRTAKHIRYQTIYDFITM